MSKLSKLETTVNGQDAVITISGMEVFNTCAFITITGQSGACINPGRRSCRFCVLDGPSSFKSSIQLLELV